MSWSDLSTREKRLMVALVVMLLVMYLSHQPEMLGVGGALICSWVALGVFLIVLVLFALPQRDRKR